MERGQAILATSARSLRAFKPNLKSCIRYVLKLSALGWIEPLETLIWVYTIQLHLSVVKSLGTSRSSNVLSNHHFRAASASSVESAHIKVIFY